MIQEKGAFVFISDSFVVIYFELSHFANLSLVLHSQKVAKQTFLSRKLTSAPKHIYSTTVWKYKSEKQIQSVTIRMYFIEVELYRARESKRSIKNRGKNAWYAPKGLFLWQIQVIMLMEFYTGARKWSADEK